jgi:Lar family restriction alleviation protein
VTTLSPQPPSLSIRHEGRLYRADVPCPRCQRPVRVLEVSPEWVEVSAADGRVRGVPDGGGASRCEGGSSEVLVMADTIFHPKAALLACPFCGSLKLHGQEHADVFPYIICESCGVSTGYARNREEAIRNWNRRAAEVSRA